MSRLWGLDSNNAHVILEQWLSLFEQTAIVAAKQGKRDSPIKGQSQALIHTTALTPDLLQVTVICTK